MGDWFFWLMGCVFLFIAFVILFLSKFFGLSHHSNAGAGEAWYRVKVSPRARNHPQKVSHGSNTEW